MKNGAHSVCACVLASARYMCKCLHVFQPPSTCQSSEILCVFICWYIHYRDIAHYPCLVFAWIQSLFLDWVSCFQRRPSWQCMSAKPHFFPLTSLCSQETSQTSLSANSKKTHKKKKTVPKKRIILEPWDHHLVLLSGEEVLIPDRLQAEKENHCNNEHCKKMCSLMTSWL